LYQALLIDWFGQVHVEARFERLCAIRLLPPAGDGDELQLLRPRLRTQAPRELVAVELGHANVE
jgi:hypothetical protein